MKKAISLSIALFLIVLLPALGLAFQIPDTGQTGSYTDIFGEDSDYTINPPSYTKLDSQGNELSDSATEWTMVKDNVTGLIWEVKTYDGSIHDKDDEYAWQDTQDVFIAALNSQNFGGYSDWRLPTVKELSIIVNSGAYSPAINQGYFPNTVARYYWSFTTHASYTDYAWRVTFGSRFVYGDVSPSRKSNSYYVRAIRGGGAFDNLVINGDGTVTDTNTGLMWQQDTAGSMTWEEALTYCENLSLAGYNDWRLPNRNELQTLVDYNEYSPAIDTTAFPDTQSSRYWSSTTDAYHTDDAWRVYFSQGNVYPSNKSSTYYVRAVRGGQSGSFGPLVISLPATSVTSDSATLNGTVNPNGAGATYYFEYGLTTSYGSTTESASAGSGTSAVSVNAPISGLTQNTTYHYRLVATNSVGTSYGDDKTFSTTILYVQVKANDQDGPIVVSPSTPVSIDISLAPGDKAGQTADWWIAVKTPFAPPGDWYAYVHPTGWMPGVNLCAQAGLFDLAPFEVLNMTLPVGTYTFYFALDDPDGMATGPWWGLDSVEVTVQ